ncbi:MAG: DUF1801 domain-containing protein [Pseudomonadota bacterium]
MALLTFTGAQPDNFRVEEWLADHENGELGALATYWYRQIRVLCPNMSELLHDSFPTACLGEYPFAYVGMHKAHVNLGFFYGAELPDPNELLQGAGRLGRHVKLRPDQAVDQTALNSLITAAYNDIDQRIKDD